MNELEKKITDQLGKQVPALNNTRQEKLAAMIDMLLMVASVYADEKERADRETAKEA